MTLFHVRCAAALTVAMLAAPPTAPAQTSATPVNPVELGRALAQRNCGMCHAIGPTGDSPLPDAPSFRSLHRRLDVDRLSAPLARGIITRHPAMPEFRFDASEVDALVKYLKSVQEVARA